MKRFFPLLALLAMPLFGTAQDAQTVTHPNEIGVNVTPLLTRVFNVSSFMGTDTDVLNFSYKRVLQPNRAIRVLGGLAVSTSVDESQNEFTFSTWSHDLSLGLGYEWRIVNESKWLPYLGADLRFQNTLDRTENKSSFDTTTTETTEQRVGGGFVLGCQFKLNERLRLSTEAALVANSRVRSTEFVSDNFPATNNTSKVTGLEIQTQVPLSIFLILAL